MSAESPTALPAQKCRRKTQQQRRFFRTYSTSMVFFLKTIYLFLAKPRNTSWKTVRGAVDDTFANSTGAAADQTALAIRQSLGLSDCACKKRVHDNTF